ncbi:MAG: endonuclease MutS2 [Lachnospirales bacterium]
MNITTIETLNYNKVKEIIKSFCVSGLGKSLIDKIQPTANLKTINHWQEETSEAKALLDIGYNIPLKGISDISHIIEKIEKEYTLEISELVQITDFLRGCKSIKKFFINKEDYAKNLSAYSLNITEMPEIEEEINTAIRNNAIQSEATKELKTIRRHKEVCEGKIKEKLEKILKNSVVREYLQENIIVQRNGKYCVPVKSQYKNQVDGSLVDQSATGSTAFIEPNAIKKYTLELEILKVEEEVEIYKILSMLTNIVYLRIFELQMNVDIIGKYDMIYAKGKYSVSHKGISPKINEDGYINIIDGVHPLIENFVPLNFAIGNDYRGLLITGPNAGGKTVVLKTVGLLTMMAMSGFHIEAKIGTNISIFKNIFVDIGDNQSIENSLSTFSSHMNNLSNIIKKSNKDTLVLLDEIGSGTEPKEGASLGIAILEHLYKKGAIILVTSHYGEIKTFSEKHQDFENAAMEYKIDILEPLFKLKIGKSGNSNAFYIAEKMGIPKEVREKAFNYISNKEYETKKLWDNKVVKNKEIVNDDVEIKKIFSKGDRVILLDENEIGIVYEPLDKENNVTIYFKKKFKKVFYKRIELQGKAEDLYPQGYDLNTLFTEYKERKLEHDIERGSKKVLKKIMKNTN